MTEKNKALENANGESANPLEKKRNLKTAFEQAEMDIENDPETTLNEDADLDEGELARKEGHP